MNNLYIVKSGKLKRKDNTLIFENKEEKRFFPIQGIDSIYIFSEININSKLLFFLTKVNVPIFFFNYYGYYAGVYSPREEKLSGRLLVNQVKSYLNKDRLKIAKNFLKGAFHNMKKTLIQYDLMEEAEKIGTFIEKIKPIKSNNLLLLKEAECRKYYYKQFNKILRNPEFKFIQRVRRPPDNFINTLISFGNSLLYTVCLSEILKTPLNPTVSFLHEPFERRYSLNLDIAEIFKPLIVDRVIFTLINKKMIKAEHFDKELNYCYLNKEGRILFLREFDNKLKTTLKYPNLNRSVSYRYMLRLETYKLIKFFEEGEEYKPFKIYW